MLGKYLSAFGEYTESIKEYLENMAIWGYCICGTQNRPRMHGKYLIAFREYAE